MSKVVVVIPAPVVVHRDPHLAWAAKNDPTRYRTRKIRPEKGPGRKERPRNRNYATE